MAAVMDLDLNCEPPEPEQPAPAPQDHHRLQRAMLRQEHAFRHQVKDLHRLYWTHKNLPDDVPFWNQSDVALYARHSLDGSSQVIDLEDSEDRPAANEVGKRPLRYGNGVAENWGAEGSVGKRHGLGGEQGRPRSRRMIDLEKLATSEDDDEDVEFVSSAEFSVNANRKGVFLDNSQRRLLENTTHVRSGSTGSSDTPDSSSPIKEKATASGRPRLIDLNVTQEDDLNGFTHPSKVLCSLLASSSTIQSTTEYCGNSSKALQMTGESSIGSSSKESSITVLTSISAEDSAREAMIAPGFCDPQSSCKPFHVEGGSTHDTSRLRGNIHQYHNTLQDVSGMSSQGGSMGVVPREGFISVRSSGGNAASVGHREDYREETLTAVISDDDEMGGFDLNVSVGSIELPSTVVSSLSENHLNGSTGKLVSSHYLAENEGQQNVSYVEDPTIRDESIDGRSVRSPESRSATTNRPISIPETPQGRDYACPRLRPSSSTAPHHLDTTSSMHQPGTETQEDDEKVAATAAAETLVSIFTDSSAWIADSRCSNNQADEPRDEPQISVDSFEEGVMNLEQMRDDGDSAVPVRAPDKDDGPSCGIKLKRGRGMRDFQREILPGLVSLARHEICDDLHAIGYELRKTRRRNPGDKYSPSSTRSRLPRRCSNAWN